MKGLLPRPAGDSVLRPMRAGRIHQRHELGQDALPALGVKMGADFVNCAAELELKPGGGLGERAGVGIAVL